MGALFRIRPVKGGSQGSGNFSQWLAQTYSDNSENHATDCEDVQETHCESCVEKMRIKTTIESKVVISL